VFFQERYELLLKVPSVVVFALPLDIGYGVRLLGDSDREGAVPFLPRNAFFTVSFIQ
jgi:hypothetical protein